jgi:hypothetical protein
MIRRLITIRIRTNIILTTSSSRNSKNIGNLETLGVEDVIKCFLEGTIVFTLMMMTIIIIMMMMMMMVMIMMMIMMVIMMMIPPLKII